MKSWKRYRGSVLLAYLKREFSHPLQILWWILCCGDNWDILKTETARYLWGLQQVKKLVYLRLMCYFSVKGVIGISSPPYLAGMFLFSPAFISVYCTNFCQFVLPYYIKTDRSWSMVLKTYSFTKAQLDCLTCVERIPLICKKWLWRLLTFSWQNESDKHICLTSCISRYYIILVADSFNGKLGHDN